MSRPSVIPRGMKLVGATRGDEDLVVFGRIEGPIEITGMLVIEAGGAVRGDVQAKTVTIRGALAGDAHAEESLWVEEGARVVGDLRGPRVKVADGARFTGRVEIGALREPIGTESASPKTLAEPASERQRPPAPKMPRIERTRARRRARV